ncbi:hypothetical protein [Lacipirellula parvula]|uniref:Uncharacterized protein n=1 Tax=Lacipirellula parvula TaxID=2650471 RepID=A0A5K7XHI1_9BACT|nr:hypothetical protein [Lacipirellula parvula]BBO35447.1 hypothetical protein PLANPX_5059 [Lacipirellula parvula]
MTKSLQEAFERASQLPPDEQEAFGAWMLHELDSEQRWDELFNRSPDLLSKLADEALAEHRAGKTKPLNPETL